MARKRTAPKSSKTQQRPADSSIYRPGGPLLTRAVSGPIATRAVGGPITSRAGGGPVKPRAAAEALTIVYVHGIGNKPAPAILKRQCDQALFGIDMGDRTRVAYWADIRYPQPLASGESEGPSTRVFETRELGATLDERVASRLPYGEVGARYAVGVARKLLGPAGGNGPRARGVQARNVQTKILPDLIRRPVTEWLTNTFIEDTAAYFFDREQRAEMQQRLSQILLAGTGSYIVVAHSQGSIIAYDVLRNLEKKAAFVVPLLVTIGSPLGLEEVQDHAAKPLSVPGMVEAWWNFADRIDPVALDKDLADEFTPKGTIQDRKVVNEDTLRLVRFNPHSGTGYLSTDEVREKVKEHLPPTYVSPLAPFVIARDLAAEMADPTVRLPVLIELRGDDTTATMEGVGDRLERELREIERTFKAQLPESERSHDYFQIDRLRRYVAATLSAEEVDYLAARHQNLEIRSLWKNSAKRALLDRSIDTVQVRTAQLGYGALGQGIAWAILDTGIAADHPHFKAHQNVAARWDCTRPGKPVPHTGPDNKDGHGTHVAGIIAGEQEDDKAPQYSGMAPRAKLHIYRVLDDDGAGRDSWIIKAIDHIASVNEAASDLVIHGVNLSLGGPFDEAVFACGFSPICRELRRLWRQGVAVCIAAGNEGRLIIDTAEGEQKLNLDLSIGDPANLEEAIAVGSVHRDSPHMYGISFFSSRGPTADGRPKPDVVAPGEKIVSCRAQATLGDSTTHYIAMSGTSMACPHVSGIIAAFLSVRREFIGHPDRVKEILMRNTTDLGRDRYHQGAGMPNLVKMLVAT